MTTPEYVHDLLDSHLTGQPLDFHGHQIPDDVRRRLEQGHIESEDVAAQCPWAMKNDGGEYFYPDSPEDAALFEEDHGAKYVDPDFKWDNP